MKIDFNKNPLKLMVFGNLFSLTGLFYLLVYLWLVRNLYVVFIDNLTGAGEGLIFCTLLVAAWQAITASICLVLLLVEMLFGHKIKIKFFKENKIYNVIFHIGFIFNAIMLLLIAIFWLQIMRSL